MELAGTALVFLGLLIFLIGGFWFLIAAFRVSIWWGLACLFIPIVQIFFLIVHWRVAKSPFLLQVVAFIIILVGFYLSPQTLHHRLPGSI